MFIVQIDYRLVKILNFKFPVKSLILKLQIFNGFEKFEKNFEALGEEIFF